MKNERIASKKFQGVYYRLLQGRHNGKFDRMYWISWTQHGKKQWHPIGKASEGVTEAYAHQQRIDIINKVRFGENPTTALRHRDVTLHTLMIAYLDWRKAEKKHPAQEEGRYTGHIHPVFGDTVIASISLADLDRFKADKLAVLSPSSVKKIFTLMKSAVNFGIKRGMYTGKNPFAATSNFSMPKEENKGERFLTPKEAHDLLEEIRLHSSQLYSMAFVSLYTGMRSTELFGLRGIDIDEKNKTVTFFAKGGERETVLLTQEALDELIAHRTTPDALLFPGKDGERKKGISKTFERCVNKLDLNRDIPDKRHKVWFHTLRHTFASWLAQSGQVGIYDLMKLMRHRKIEMTMRYAHLIPDRKREQLTIINQTLLSAVDKTQASDQDQPVDSEPPCSNIS